MCCDYSPLSFSFFGGKHYSLLILKLMSFLMSALESLLGECREHGRERLGE